MCLSDLLLTAQPSAINTVKSKINVKFLYTSIEIYQNMHAYIMVLASSHEDYLQIDDSTFFTSFRMWHWSHNLSRFLSSCLHLRCTLRSTRGMCAGAGHCPFAKSWSGRTCAALRERERERERENRGQETSNRHFGKPGCHQTNINIIMDMVITADYAHTVSRPVSALQTLKQTHRYGNNSTHTRQNPYRYLGMAIFRLMKNSGYHALHTVIQERFIHTQDGFIKFPRGKKREKIYTLSRKR